jgi:cell division protein FtsI (penicillin-binding protein 3)
MTQRRPQPHRPAARTPCAQDLGQRQDWTIEVDGAAKTALETGRTRLIVATLVVAAAFLAIALRLVEVAVLSEGYEPRIARTPARDSALETGRAMILDRNGEVLATTLPTASLYANPRHIGNAEAAANRLAAVLPDISRAELLAKFSADRGFVWIKRNLTPRETASVNRLGIPGLYFQREERRFYPHGALVSHVVGFTDIDNRGLSGIEQGLDDLLRGSSQPLQLSIDLRLQHILAEELAAAMAEFRGVGAAGVVLDAKSGEILALASLPSFDPNRPGNAPAEARFNRVTLGVYEMGSVFKIFTTAMALEEGAVRLSDGFDVSHPIRVARYTIRDFKPKNRWLSIPEIFMYSSNIGTVHMAMASGTAAQKQVFGRLGLLRAATIEIPEVAQPMLPSPWREINTMTISYGHGIAVTPLQTARAVAAVVNGGQLPQPTLIRQQPGEALAGTPVLSEKTSEKMRWLLRLVVANGTGRKANAPGYLVGGKTGTADKLKASGGYAKDKRIASFAGAFPMTDPRYVIFAMVDEPKPTEHTYGYATGGWVAAPVVGRTVSRMAPLLGIAPHYEDEEEGPNPLLIPANLRR